ncbi:MAG TPA: hypothetical protein VLZ83_14050 [Edaphocola sp.]|nr:hypothetical protein [Edaphocola sp.]
MRHHRENFFENPNSSNMLSNTIKNNMLISDSIYGGSSRELGWFGAFSRRYKKETGKKPNVKFVEFERKTEKLDKYDYNKIKKIIFNEKTVRKTVKKSDKNIYDKQLDVCDRRTDKLIEMMGSQLGNKRMDKLIDILADQLTGKRRKIVEEYEGDYEEPLKTPVKKSTKKTNTNPSFREEPVVSSSFLEQIIEPKSPVEHVPTPPTPPTPPKPVSVVPEKPKERYVRDTPIEKLEKEIKEYERQRDSGNFSSDKKKQMEAKIRERDLRIEAEEKGIPVDEHLAKFNKQTEPEKFEISQNILLDGLKGLKKTKMEGEGIYYMTGGNLPNQYLYKYDLYSHMNHNLPVYQLQQSEMEWYPQTSLSYSSEYGNRGYGAPRLNSVYIEQAPLVLNGQIVYGGSGCLTCS